MTDRDSEPLPIDIWGEEPAVSARTVSRDLNLWEDEQAAGESPPEPEVSDRDLDLELWPERNQTAAPPPRVHPLSGTLDDLWQQPEDGDEARPPVERPVPASRGRTVGHSRKDAEVSGIFSWRLVATATFGLVLLGLIVDGASALFSLRTELRAVSVDLARIEGSFREGDLSAAESAVTQASASAQEALQAARRPALMIGARVPGLGEDVTAIRQMAGASVWLAAAAEHIVGAGRALDIGPGGDARAVYDEGRVHLDVVESASVSLEEAERALLEASLSLEDLDPRLAELHQLVGDANAEVNTALHRVSRGSLFFKIIPPLLGGDGDRSYLLVFQAPGEARATGGLPGLVAELSAQDGKLELSKVRPYEELGKIKPVDAPAWFEESYAVQGALAEWPQANVSPNFPVVADVFLQMYEQATGSELDGVIAMDPLAMQDLLDATGPLDIPNPPREVTSANVAELLLVESYTTFPSSDEQNRFLRVVISEFWERIAEGDLPPTRLLADAFHEAFATQHMKLFVRSDAEQRSLADLSMNGNYDTLGSQTQMAFNVNYAVNKVDYFLHRDLTTAIRLQPDGTAAVTTQIELENRAPAGQPSTLLGTGEDLPPGTNQMTINLLMPPGSTLDRFQVEGEDRAALTYTDDASPVVWDLLEIPPGESTTVTVDYSIPAAILGEGADQAFQFVMFPQPTVNPDTYKLTIQPPAGLAIANSSDFGSLRDERIVLTGKLEKPVTATVRLTPSGKG